MTFAPMSVGRMACPVCGRRVDASQVADDSERTRLAATHLADHDLSDVEASVYAAAMAGENERPGTGGSVGSAIVTGTDVWDRDRTGPDV